MLALDVIGHVQPPPDILREHVEIDELQYQGQYADDAGHGDTEARPPGVADDPAKTLRVGPGQPRDQGAALRRLRQANPRCQHRHQGLCDQERRQQRDDDRHGHVREEDHDVVLGADDDRREDDNGCRRARDYRRSDLSHALQRGVERLVLFHRTVSENAFRDDDGIIDEHADGEHQPHHRENV